MKIANLEHVESVSTSDVLGGFGSYSPSRYDFNRSKRLDINIYERVNTYKNLNTYSFVYGNSALAEGDAEAYGLDSNAQSFSYTYTDPFSSAASATSISQS
ncbi:MAG: Paired box protein 7 [Phormidesmis priestleyi Ana]|uniref:Paired box protein 7 n=1 Tax=Phormidesmis priestleyi Ana TaxID=1666911 RepID=A0A0P7Z2R9_9CYAN|nr:MAG: Paired box protein 7 [Phormidesmis priestleyi Ana]